MKLFSMALLLVLSISANFVCITAYSQVLVSSSNTTDSDGPRIFKALNTDLIFPKTFNSSENVISTTEVFQAASSTTEPASTISTTTTQLPWPYNHRAETEGVPIFVTPSSVSEPSVATSEIVKNTPQDESQVIEHSELTSTGRAVDYRTGYPFGQLLTPLIKPASPNTVRKRPPSAQGYNRGPMQRRPSGYAQPSNGYYKQRQPSRAEQNKLKGKATFTDRFSPSQATAAGIFVRQKENFDHDHSHDHNHNHNHANDGKVPAASDVVQSYVPPKNQYAFPPLNANYPSPSDDPKAAVPTSSVTSYLPPASGPLLGSEGIAGYQYPGPPVAAGGYQYPGPVKPTPQDNKSADDGNANGDDDGDNDDTIGVLPASAMDMAGDGGKGANGGSADDGGDAAGGDDMKGADDGNGDGDGGDDTKPADGGGPSNDYDPNKEYPTPPPGWLQSHPESAVPQPSDHDHDHDHDHHHDHHEHDHPHDYEHDHHHEHDHGLPDYSDIIQYPQGFPSFDSFPEHHHHPHIIYDDHFPHYHHHHVEPPPPPPPPTTEPPPPPEPAPEPRVKKYSYFYIGRKLWYIPLYFTVWFSFYVLWLIIKSIARHKVNLPNHYVNRRSLPDYSTHKRDEYINNLTVSVLGHIDSFRQKYLT